MGYQWDVTPSGASRQGGAIHVAMTRRQVPPVNAWAFGVLSQWRPETPSGPSPLIGPIASVLGWIHQELDG
jgi:hypothetical protein